MGSYTSLHDALDAAAAMALARSKDSFVAAHACGDIDTATRDAMLAEAVRRAPEMRERLRKKIIARYRAAGHGCPDDWGLEPGAALNDLDHISVQWADAPRQATSLDALQIMGIA